MNPVGHRRDEIRGHEGRVEGRGWYLCWFSSGTGDAKRETVPAIEHIEQMCQTMH